MKKVVKNILCLIIFFIIIIPSVALAADGCECGAGSHSQCLEPLPNGKCCCYATSSDIKNSNSANIPEMLSCLVPVKYNNGAWDKIEKSSESGDWYDYDWYDYENGIWATAKLGNDVYVWIPRFTYKIENNQIKIRWSQGEIDDISGGYSSHPAFYFGEYFGGSILTEEDKEKNFSQRNGHRNELKGFWIKQDLVESDLTTLEDVSNAFKDSIDMTKNSSYGLPPLGAYTHMTKASEWGALAYLTAAKGNFSNSTGNTALNHTGVNIDLAISEFVAGINGNPTDIDIYSTEYKRYRDILDKELKNYYGYALSETKDGESQQIENLALDSFLIRGGALELFGYKGVNSDFIEKNKNKNYGYRTSISIVTEELTEPVAFFDTETSVMEGDYLVLGVDFYVSEEWKFSTDPSKFFMGNEKKVVDIECIYEGLATWHQAELNAKVIKLIKSDLTEVKVENMKFSDKYPAGKYTLVIRVGGRDSNGDSVLMPVDNMEVKIIINELNLAKASENISSNTPIEGLKNPIKIASIPNNKVKLNIYNESGTTVASRYELKVAPTKKEYNLGQPLDLQGGEIISYLGKYGNGIIYTTDSRVKPVDPNITDRDGTKTVKFKCNGLDVDDTNVQYVIEVSKVKPLDVTAKIQLGSNAAYTLWSDEFYRESTDIKEDLDTGNEFLEGYMFSKWTSDLSNVTIQDSSKFSTKFTVPKKSVTLSKDKVNLTASYIAPSELIIENQKLEFLVNQDFSLGNTGVLTTVYRKNTSSEVRREITLKNAGVNVTLKDENGNVQELYKLQEGFYTVTIEVAGAKTSYEIEVIRAKYALTILTDTNKGVVNGVIKNAKDVVKDTITISDGSSGITKSVPYLRPITLTATPKEGYTFVKWEVSSSGIILDTDISKETVTFLMPEKDITVEAVFTKMYTITFKIKAGQEHMGKLSGETTQVISYKESTSPVIAVPNANYCFVEWQDSKGVAVSSSQQLVCKDIMGNAEYTAVFDNTWTVTFYNESTEFKKITVRNGQSGNINEVPAKYGYLFQGWDKDLRSITSNTITNALFIPRIVIEKTSGAAVNTIDASITGNEIKSGTLQYIISANGERPQGSIYSYKVDSTFTGIEGDWYNVSDYYRSKAVSVGNDSSSVITISSSDSTEVITFSYMLSGTSDSELGITINGEKVVSPDKEISSGWNVFREEVDVVDGKIKIGLSYTQGTGNSDYAAIKNLEVEKKWINIPNNYHLLTNMEVSENYVHVRGIGEDDSIMYYVRSEIFAAEGTILDEYTITFNASGGTGSMTVQKFTEGISKELPQNGFTKAGYVFAGWTSVPGTGVEYADKASYVATKDAILYAVWQEKGPDYSITTIVHEGGIINGVYQNEVCSRCGKKDHLCEVTNIIAN